MRAGHNAPAVGGNVDTGDGLVVSLQLILKLEGVSGPAIELNGRIASDGERLAVGRERVVGDGGVEKVVDLGSGHDERFVRDRSIALYYHYYVGWREMSGGR